MEKQTLVIDRTVWLRGEGTRKSFLFRESDGKMCCLGIYLEGCGIPKSELAGRMSPTELQNGVPVWLTRPSDYNAEVRAATLVCGRLMEINDAVLNGTDVSVATEEERESQIQKYFAEAGIEVQFIN